MLTCAWSLQTTTNGLDRNALVKLDPDHPGFRDPEYRARRNAIAQIAMTYHPGSANSRTRLTRNSNIGVWQTIWKALGPAHREHACAEYLECLERLEFDTDRIPQLDEVSRKVEAISGFRLEPVAGLVEPRIFLESLARGVFLSHAVHSSPLDAVVHAGARRGSRDNRPRRNTGEHTFRGDSIDCLAKQ